MDSDIAAGRPGFIGNKFMLRHYHEMKQKWSRLCHDAGMCINFSGCATEKLRAATSVASLGTPWLQIWWIRFAHWYCPFQSAQPAGSLISCMVSWFTIQPSYCCDSCRMQISLCFFLLMHQQNFQHRIIMLVRFFPPFLFQHVEI